MRRETLNNVESFENTMKKAEQCEMLFIHIALLIFDNLLMTCSFSVLLIYEYCAKARRFLFILVFTYPKLRGRQLLTSF